jgi:hypothetical protein
MEYIGKEGINTVHGTVHYGLSGAQHQYSESGITFMAMGNLNQTFHTYAVERTEGGVRWYIDDIEYSSITREDMSPYLWPFDEEFYFIINLAVGGNWPGNPVLKGDSTGNAVTLFPQNLAVDYVRVYDGAFSRIIGKIVVDCQETDVLYELTNLDSILEKEGVFTWMVPDGATIIAGDGTPRIKVNFYSVVRQNNINDSEIIRVQLISHSVMEKAATSIGDRKLQSGIGLRIKVVDYDGKCASDNKTVPTSKFTFDCGRPDTCTPYVLHRTTENYTCGERIHWLMNEGLDELRACTEVACELSCCNLLHVFYQHSNFHVIILLSHPDRQFHGHCGPCNPLLN